VFSGYEAQEWFVPVEVAVLQSLCFGGESLVQALGLCKQIPKLTSRRQGQTGFCRGARIRRLGVALILEIVSIYYSGPVFWAVFCTCYIIGIIMVTLNIHNRGRFKYRSLQFFIEVSQYLSQEFKEMIADKNKGRFHFKIVKLFPL